MLKKLRKDVYEANMLLVKHKLVTFTWGNASGLDPDAGIVAIKPSGVPYEKLTPDDIVLMSLEDGSVVDGKLNPSSDAATHLELYRAFPGVLGVVHTHSRYATAFAQAEEALPCYGTTHADTFFGMVPVTRALTIKEIQSDYEANTGKVIVETFKERGITPLAIPAALVSKHAPFTWGKSALSAAEASAVLEEVARMAIFTRMIRADTPPASDAILQKHYLRKHGKDAYYGQKKEG